MREAHPSEIDPVIVFVSCQTRVTLEWICCSWLNQDGDPEGLCLVAASQGILGSKAETHDSVKIGEIIPNTCERSACNCLETTEGEENFV